MIFLKYLFATIYAFNLITLALLLAFRLHRRQLSYGARIGARMLIVASVVAIGTLTTRGHPAIRVTAVLYTLGALVLEYHTHRQSEDGFIRRTRRK